MRPRLHNKACFLIALTVFVALPVSVSFTAWPLPIGHVSGAIRSIAPWRSTARVNPDPGHTAMGMIVERADGSLDALDTDDPSDWAEDLDWWGNDDGLDKWLAYDNPRSPNRTRGLLFDIGAGFTHMRGVASFPTNKPVPSDAELLALANKRAGTINQWNDSWFDRVAADGELRFSRRQGLQINPLLVGIEVLWVLSALVAFDAWRHRERWSSASAEIA